MAVGQALVIDAVDKQDSQHQYNFVPLARSSRILCKPSRPRHKVQGEAQLSI